jgi:hypothetical protein
MGTPQVAWQIEKGARSKLLTWLKWARPKLPDRLKRAHAQNCLLDWNGNAPSCLTDWKGRTHKIAYLIEMGTPQVAWQIERAHTFARLIEKGVRTKLNTRT